MIESTKPTKSNRLSRSSKLFKTIISAIEEKKGNNIVSLDLKKIDEAVADFFIICDVQSHTQMRAILDNIEKRSTEECDEKAYHRSESNEWSLSDYINIVIHVFEESQRKFYDIEGLWMDADRKEHN
jgi:ribosome-associated protein